MELSNTLKIEDYVVKFDEDVTSLQKELDLLTVTSRMLGYRVEIKNVFSKIIVRIYGKEDQLTRDKFYLSLNYKDNKVKKVVLSTNKTYTFLFKDEQENMSYLMAKLSDVKNNL